MNACLYPHWQAMAENYRAWEGQGLTPHSLAPFMEHIRSPVLLIGSGAGTTLQHLLNTGFYGWGIDQSPAMCVLARQRLGPHIVQALGSELPFPERSFASVIITTGVLDIDYQIDRRLIMREARRVLDDNGNLMLSVYHPSPRVQQAGKDLGLMSGLCFHQQRAYRLWLDKGDEKSWALRISRFRAIPIQQAQALVAQYLDLLQDLQRSLDEKAQHARLLGLDPVDHLRNCLDYKLLGWSEQHYREVLEELGLCVYRRSEEPWGPTLNLLMTVCNPSL